jgi:hypothetical protein
MRVFSDGIADGVGVCRHIEGIYKKREVPG